MPGINLAQSVSTASQKSEVSRVALFGPGFFWGLFLFLLGVGAYGGVMVYSAILTKQLSGIEGAITNQSTSGLAGKDMNHVNDTYTRLVLMKGSVETEVSPTKLMNAIAGVTVQSVRLTQYHYDASTKTLSLEGDTSNFQYLAQQVMAIKGMKKADGNTATFSSVLISKIAMSKDGIHFGVTAVGGI